MTRAAPSFAAGLAGSSFPWLAALYAALFAAFGSESPFFPSFLAGRGLRADQIGLFFAMGTIARLSLGPVIGAIADRAGVRLSLAIAALASGLIGLAYLWARTFAVVIVIGLAHAAALASLNPLADALALGASRREPVFAYGWVRGVGSAAFVLATLASGPIVAHFGLDSIIVVSSAAFASMVLPLPGIAPSARAPARDAADPPTRVLVLLRNPRFGRVLVVAGLVIGSQSMSDTFAVIHWRASGVAETTIGALWAEAVASEIVMFLAVGPMLLRRLGAASCATLAAAAGIVQWGMLATTAAPAALVFSQPLHGFTFALTHLTCMAVIEQTIPPDRLATAQALYGTLCLGVASALVTSASGELWGPFGAHAFWAMAGLCAAAIPVARSLPASKLSA